MVWSPWCLQCPRLLHFESPKERGLLFSSSFFLRGKSLALKTIRCRLQPLLTSEVEESKARSHWYSFLEEEED